MLIQIDGLGSGRTLGNIPELRVSARVALSLSVQMAKEAAWRAMVDRFISCAAYSQVLSAFQSLVNLLINLLAPTRSTIKSDLDFILQQILISEQHARDSWDIPGTPLADIIEDPLLSHGLRTVDGTYNNLLDGQSEFGAADNIFPRLLQQNLRNDLNGDQFLVDINGPAPGGVIVLNSRPCKNPTTQTE